MQVRVCDPGSSSLSDYAINPPSFNTFFSVNLQLWNPVEQSSDWQGVLVGLSTLLWLICQNFHVLPSIALRGGWGTRLFYTHQKLPFCRHVHQQAAVFILGWHICFVMPTCLMKQSDALMEHYSRVQTLPWLMLRLFCAPSGKEEQALCVHISNEPFVSIFPLCSSSQFFSCQSLF